MKLEKERMTQMFALMLKGKSFEEARLLTKAKS
jgi:hypothetical protein